MATGWTGPTFEGRAHGGPGSPSKPSNGPGLTRARLTVGLTGWTGSRAHGPGPRSWTGSPAHGRRGLTRAAASPGPGSPSRAHGPGLTRARLTVGLTVGLTGRSGRRADGHELDRLTVQALQARGHGSRSRAHRPATGPGSRRAEGHELDRPDLREPRPVQGRAHESTAHRLTVQALEPGPAHGLTGWTGPTFESRGQSRAGPTAHRRADGHELDRLTVQALEAREHGSPAHGLTAPSRPSKHESRAGRPRTVQGSREPGSPAEGRAHRSGQEGGHLGAGDFFVRAIAQGLGGASGGNPGGVNALYGPVTTARTGACPDTGSSF